MQSPLPVRDGVNATRLRLPDEGPWDTAMDYMMHRWGHIDPQGIEDRFDAGEIVGEAGIPLAAPPRCGTTPSSGTTARCRRRSGSRWN